MSLAKNSCSVKIVNSHQMNLIDEAAISRIGLSARVLMEHAGKACFASLLELESDIHSKEILVLAGSGHNGGDGLVLARMAHAIGCRVKVLFLAKEPRSEDQDIKDILTSCRSLGLEIAEVRTEDNLTKFFDSCKSSRNIIIDALTGTGFKGEPRGLLPIILSYLSTLSSESLSFAIYSIDIPSGNSCDEGVDYAGVRADVTWALQCLKPIHVNPSADEYVGTCILLDCSIPSILPEIENIRVELISESTLSSILRSVFPDPRDSYKKTKGHVLIIGGSPGHFGAPILSAIGALRSGAGLVSILSPEGGAHEVPPEIMLHTFPLNASNSIAQEGGTLKNILEGKNAIVIGPGLGVSDLSKEILRFVMIHCGKTNIPLVLDADALNLISLDSELEELLSATMILTPHYGEFSRLQNGIPIAEIKMNRLKHSRDCLLNKDSVLVLKGPHTVISSREKAQLVSPYQSSALGVAGSGDVLSGIIVALLARGLSTYEAAALGVFLHARAGLSWEESHQGKAGMLAHEIGDLIPSVLSEVLNFTENYTSLSRCIKSGRKNV